MREKVQSMLLAIARVRIVLPTPGTSSSKTCPLASSASSTRRTVSLLPSRTDSTLSCNALSLAILSIEAPRSHPGEIHLVL